MKNTGSCRCSNCTWHRLDRRRSVYGKKLENHLSEMVTQANEQLKRTAPEAGVELSYQNYQRGVFSSHLQLVVKPVAGADTTRLKPGQSIVLDESVSHGPFPLAQLKTLNLILLWHR